MQHLCPDFQLHTDLFDFRFEAGTRPGYYVRSSCGKAAFIYPPQADFSDPRTDAWLRKALVEELRKQARSLLPPRLQALAQAHGFAYRRVTIKNARSRWGSCSSLGNINLSLYLLLLPTHLIDYVMLHELCHTREMNHGPRFWALLDSLTDGKAHALRREIREFRIPF